MAEEYDGKERRTDHYLFTSIEQIKGFYSEFIKPDILERLIAGIDGKDLVDREEGKAAHKLHRFKRLEWHLNRYIKDHGVDYDPGTNLKEIIENLMDNEKGSEEVK